MNKLYSVLIMVLILLCSFVSAICDYEINESWVEEVNILVYDYGTDFNSRLFPPNLIKIYNNCSNRDVLIHELAHYNDYRIRKVLSHDSFFWLTYYRIKYDNYGESFNRLNSMALEEGLMIQPRLPIPKANHNFIVKLSFNAGAKDIFNSFM